MEAITILLLLGLGWMLAFIITRGFGYRVQNPEVGLGFALFRTTRLNRLIVKIAGKGKRIWKFSFDLGVVAAIGLMILALVLLLANIPAFFIRKKDTPAVGVAPVIPGITVSFSSLPYFLVAIAIGIAAHELCHGIAASNENVSLKSTGVFLFLLFIGAFVEMKEEKIKASSQRSRLRIFAAGALANLVLTYLFLLILLIPVAFPLAIAWGYETDPSGVLITGVLEDSPAEQVGIQEGWVIEKVATPNESTVVRRVKNTEDFRKALNDVKVNDTVGLWFKDHDNVFLIAKSLDEDNDDEDKGYIGVRYFNFFKPILPLPPSLPFHVYVTIIYIIFVNMMLALFNLLPIPLLDGDKVVGTLLENKGEWGKRLHKWIRILAFGALVINMSLTFLTGGWMIM